MVIPGLRDGLFTCAEFWCVTRYDLPGPIRLLDVSSMLCDLVGYSRSELLALSIADIMHPDDAEGAAAARAELIRAAPASGVFRTKTRWRDRMGRYLHLEWASSTVSPYTFHVARNATERVMQEAEAQLRLGVMRELATTDTLTGLKNRRVMLEDLDREWDRSRRTGSPLSVAAFDVDHFKRVNDTQGHDAGDEVLRLVADSIRRSVRTMDMCYRPGGEEFTVLLPECDALGALDVLNRVMGSIRRETPVTASAGFGCFPGHAISPAGLLKAADTAMYESKRRGRDRISASGVFPIP